MSAESTCISGNLPSLAICIPCYNRPDWLRFCLESIIRQAPPYAGRIKVYIRDNSDDDSSSLTVRSLEWKNLPYEYAKNDENIGAVANLLAVIRDSQQDFVWLIGDDDWITDGGLVRVFDELDRSVPVDGIFVNSCTFDNSGTNPAIPLNTDLSQRCGSRDRVFEDGYEALEAMSFHIGYISASVFKRSAWLDLLRHQPGILRCGPYMHACGMVQLVARSNRWAYVDSALVAARGETDAWLQRGDYLTRVCLIVQGGDELLNGINWRPGQRNRIARHICRHFVGSQLRRCLRLKSCFKLRVKFFRLLAPHYWRLPDFYTHILPSIVLPRAVLMWLQKRRTKEWKSFQRDKREEGNSTPDLGKVS